MFSYDTELGVRHVLQRNRNMSSEEIGSHKLQLKYQGGWTEEVASELDSRHITCNAKTMRADTANAGDGKGTDMRQHGLENVVVRTFSCKDDITLSDKDFFQGFVGK